MHPEAASPKPDVQITSGDITWANRWDHFLARWGVNRGGHRVEPGLYAQGSPTASAPVFVTANYTLSFDALRSVLAERDSYILVLDTQGINVWCAAGKGTFGTDELVHRIEVTGLHDIVDHRILILPQLGAAGVSAHQVRQRSRFRVEYGPVRAADLPTYLETHQATPEMRRVRFDLWDRLVLIPVELVHVLIPLLIVAVALFLLGGPLTSGGAIAAVLAGVVLFPVLLPWLPSGSFSTRGFILGGIVALPFALVGALSRYDDPWWLRVIGGLSYLLAMPPVTAYLALNFTGSTPYTSRSGVRREIFRYIPAMASMFGMGLLLTVAYSVVKLAGKI